MNTPLMNRDRLKMLISPETSRGAESKSGASSLSWYMVPPHASVPDILLALRALTDALGLRNAVDAPRQMEERTIRGQRRLVASVGSARAELGVLRGKVQGRSDQFTPPLLVAPQTPLLPMLVVAEALLKLHYPDAHHERIVVRSEGSGVWSADVRVCAVEPRLRINTPATAMSLAALKRWRPSQGLLVSLQA